MWGLLVNNKPHRIPPWESNIFTSAFRWKHLSYPRAVCLEKRQALWESIPAGRGPPPLSPSRNLTDIDVLHAASTVPALARRLFLTQNRASNPGEIVKEAIKNIKEKGHKKKKI